MIPDKSKGAKGIKTNLSGFLVLRPHLRVLTLSLLTLMLKTKTKNIATIPLKEAEIWGAVWWNLVSRLLRDERKAALMEQFYWTSKMVFQDRYIVSTL